ncbi:MAG: prepilin-type cleavage/methylation domain-containing protein [Hydrogenophilales bacterium CG_4_9_14_3_um_filter_63_34]|nr:MAG: prepilin-type cleavage/methylation domain-containing protein [Hydrogenophilales bacterium CG_4_10_14_3_um_filter_63_21]PJB03176.1 MAG: prepilin-type cleavage/methylation domain-containing protein [Hydrogenophilales bacterium CG_4_9_14_3_um_filter_63_34]
MANSGKGFTLVELAIVLFVITLLLGGMLTPLSQQIAERQNSDTRHTLDAARTALAGYALSHRDSSGKPYLPCPDRHGGIGAGDGEEDRLADGRCAVVVGGLPWHSLGVAEVDAWGNRLDYAVSPDYADASHGIVHNPVPATQVSLCQEKTCTQPLAAAAVVLSHGRNGFGAHNAVGKTNLVPISADERANTDSTPRFIMHPPTAADRADGEFDDLAIWLSPAWLLGRLCDPASDCAAP